MPPSKDSPRNTKIPFATFSYLLGAQGILWRVQGRIRATKDTRRGEGTVRYARTNIVRVEIKRHDRGWLAAACGHDGEQTGQASSDTIQGNIREREGGILTTYSEHFCPKNTTVAIFKN